MNKLSKLILMLPLALAPLAGQAAPKGGSHAALAAGFVAPPDSVQTSVYWYWLSGNVSKEGVVKDLEAMKRAGINRAFIGNIGPRETFYGRMVGSDPCGAQTRLGAGYRDRHVQQPRLEPGRRAVDRTRAGHALPGFGQGACPGRREGRGGAAAPVGRFPGRAGGRLSRSRRGACGADGG